MATESSFHPTPRSRVRRLPAALLALALALLFVSAALAAGRPFRTTLTGAAEVPGPGDSDGSGRALITLDHARQELCYTLTVANIEPATMAHIHVGASNVAGPVVLGLIPPTGGSSGSCFKVGTGQGQVTSRLFNAIWDNPGNYYVNVHNGPYPAGAVRGQLTYGAASHGRSGLTIARDLFSR